MGNKVKIIKKFAKSRYNCLIKMRIYIKISKIRLFIKENTLCQNTYQRNAD